MRSIRERNLTPGITRRPAGLRWMKAVVSAVGCMPLLGGDSAPRLRGARDARGPRVAPAARQQKYARARSSSIVWADKDAAPPEHPRRPGLWVIALEGAPFTPQRI